MWANRVPYWLHAQKLSLWSAFPPRTSAPAHSQWRAQRHGTSCQRIYGHLRQLAPSRKDLSLLHPVIVANCLDTARPCNDFFSCYSALEIVGAITLTLLLLSVIAAYRQSRSAFHHCCGCWPAQHRQRSCDSALIRRIIPSLAAAIMPAAAAAAACNDDDARDATAPRCSDADKAPAFACSVRYDDNNHGQQPKQLAINSVRTARETDCPQAIRIC